MGQIVGEYPACILKYIIRKHMVAMGGMLLVLFEQKLCKQLSVLLISVQCALPVLPFVVTGLTDSHELAEKDNGIFFFHFFDDFVFASCPVTYCLFAPVSSTQDPFLTVQSLFPVLLTAV